MSSSVHPAGAATASRRCPSSTRSPFYWRVGDWSRHLRCFTGLRRRILIPYAAMTKARLEAFSDGVIAILMTIMVLELHVPHETGWAALSPLVPIFLTYVLSFVFVGIYWNNHHHMLHAADRINGKVLWANLHLLFWLSLVPFVTAWMGENHFASVPSALYGAVLIMAAIAYYILQQLIIASQGAGSLLKKAVGGDWKGKASPFLYAIAIPLAFWSRWISLGLYVLVALIWLVPDRRIEHALASNESR